MDEVAVRSFTAGDDLDRLGELWRSLVLHHRHVDPAMPVLDPWESWRRRSASYREWLASGGVCLVAEQRDVVVGYAMVSIDGPDETWDLGDQVAELQTLVVADWARGAGVGEQLVAAMDRSLANRGIDHVLVGVVAANTGALRFYDRLGWRHCYSLMHRRVPSRPEPVGRRGESRPAP